MVTKLTRLAESTRPTRVAHAGAVLVTGVMTKRVVSSHAISDALVAIVIDVTDEPVIVRDR